MNELFTTALVRKIHSEVSAELWPFFLKNLTRAEDHHLIYPVLMRMTRKSQRTTQRNQVLQVCPGVMEKVNPRFYGNYNFYNSLKK